MSISSQQDRYLRQSQFARIGEDGQQRIEQSRVAVLGCGALGSVAAELLARAGVGTLTLIDRDLVEWSNLQRQSLYVEADAIAASAKAEAAAGHLRAINSSIDIREHVVDITPANISRHLADSDLVIDATDNFPVRLLLNDWSLEKQIPWVHGGCVGASGQVRLFTGDAPCFRCLLPSAPGPGETETCDTAGVIGPATHLIASLQVAEALKWLSGNRDAVSRSVQSIDLWRNQTHAISIPDGGRSGCVACQNRQFEYLHPVTDHDQQAESLCGRDAVQIHARRQGDAETQIDFDKIAVVWEKVAMVQRTRFFIRLLLSEEQSITLFRDGRAVVSGVRDIPHARSLYDRYVGS
ncbi:ThiF family adenylyltransferase [Neorhodopirellula lusitana]|uniref:ThiF family adenylyltransferase n=1 Tax=Neorhodopirellula lusitana TaxID=445327 RepID=UPI003850A388